jgi:nitroreductase
MPGISLHDAIHGQRAIRRFSTDPVPQEAVERVLAAAARAPSGGNRQQWAFVVIRDDALKRTIGEWYLDGWNVTYASDPTRPHNATYVSAETLAHNLAATPVLILACINRAQSSGPASLAAGASIYPAVQNLMLEAEDLGLGTVITTFHMRHEDEVKALLGIPESVQTAALLPMGYPADGEHFGGSKRNAVAAFTHYDRWDNHEPAAQ